VVFVEGVGVVMGDVQLRIAKTTGLGGGETDHLLNETQQA